jgi:hypothetical protein
VSGVTDRLYDLISAAPVVENQHGTDPVEVSMAIAGLACSVATASGIGGGALSVLVTNMPIAEPDEEKAVAAVRAAYASARRVGDTVWS